MSEWQPIETAPLKGEIMLYDAYDEIICVGEASVRRGTVRWYPVPSSRDSESLEKVTHWMPLPQKPTFS